MKKTLFMLSCAVLSLAACEKENVNNPCGGSTSSASMPNFRVTQALHTINTRFYIKDNKGSYVKYTENELQLRNEQLQSVPFMMDDPDIGVKTFAFVVKGKDLFAHPAFRSDTPITQIFYLTRKDKTDTIRIESKVKNLCALDSISYLKCYQNNQLLPMSSMVSIKGDYISINY